MTQYKVDVIGELGADKQFDAIEEAFDHLKHLLGDGKRVEVSAVPEALVEAPLAGEGAPTSTAIPGDDAYVSDKADAESDTAQLELPSDPKDSLDDDADAAPETDDDDDDTA